MVEKRKETEQHCSIAMGTVVREEDGCSPLRILCSKQGNLDHRRYQLSLPGPKLCFRRINLGYPEPGHQFLPHQQQLLIDY